jgi:transcription elongation factor Elf1
MFYTDQEKKEKVILEKPEKLIGILFEHHKPEIRNQIYSIIQKYGSAGYHLYWNGPIKTQRNSTLGEVCIDGGVASVRFNCPKCNSEIIIDSIEVPRPYLGAENHEESKTYNSEDAMCECEQEFKVVIESGMWHCDIFFEDTEMEPEEFEYRIVPSPLSRDDEDY